jgi:hydrogenase-4 component B
MDILIFRLVFLLSFVLFFIPKKYQHTIALCLSAIAICITSYWGIIAFLGEDSSEKVLFYLMGSPISLIIDKLSAFFILIINFTILTGAIYARGYIKPYLELKGRLELAWHYFNFIWLHFSMLLVVMIHDGLGFLIVWELMSLSSFFLVIFESDVKETLKIGLKYLLQMHVGLVFILLAFLLACYQGGVAFSFEGLSVYFGSHQPFFVFFLFFIGFGIKAGFVPLHTWLPHAHPAAPSHVSGVMSGVMIKMGIYGILRVLTFIHFDLLPIGIFILIISVLSGVIGVTLAIVQHDMKKLLAYHSIENIGIIGIGIGLGVIGLAVNIPVLAVLGFAGGLLHILNHSLFKSLLFYTAGNVYQQTHTRNIEHLGGLYKKMPKTALLFLLGSLAICGLPPFNGFISEFLIYSGLIKSVMAGSLFVNILLLISIIGLVLIGGLAVFCFTKVFSIIFLGNPRSNKTDHAKEVKSSMVFPDYLIGIIIIVIGLAPALFMKPLADIVLTFTNHTEIITQMNPAMTNISLLSGIFVAIIGLLWLLRAWQQRNHKVSKNSTWGCAYTGANPALLQYTATSYADNLRQLAPGIVNVKKHYTEFKDEEIFPAERNFETHSTDIFENNIIEKPSNKLVEWLGKAAVFQTGKIQHYLLYALVFVIIIFLLTLVNWI